jgi:hypothetical protein
MGVDYSSRLVFGILLDFEKFKKIVRKYMPEDYVDDEIEFFYDFSLSEHYKGIYLGIAYPYLDGDCKDWTYYLGIGNEDTDSFSISEILKLVSYKDTEFEKFLLDNDIEPSEPELMSIVHVN